jgi:molybdate transport system substrate-binding protein
VRAVVIVIAGLLAAGCGGGAPAPSPKSVRIAAAADLKFAFEELSAAFRAEQPGGSVEVTFGASGSFFAQLSEGAPFDVFLSANMDYPNKLVEQGRGVNGSVFTYAVGHLVVWVPKSSSPDLPILGIRAVRDPWVRKVAIANPRHAPYGRAAEAALRTAGLYIQVKDSLVFGENVAQTAQLVDSGAADVGLIALSLAIAPPLRDRGRYVEVPAELYPPIEQGAVLLKSAEANEAARAFHAFLKSDRAHTVLDKFGFRRPKG